MDFGQLEQIATNLAFYLNIVVLAAVLFGALVGFIRGFWKASFRFFLYAILIGGGFIAMPYIIDILLDVNVSAWVPVISGIQITTLRELPGQLITMVPVEGLVITPELIEVVIELTSAILALVLFIVYLIVMSILIFPIHWILFPLTVGLFFRRKFRKKHKMRLLGAGFGAMQAALSVSLSMLPLAALDVTIRQMDNLDEDVPFGTALSAIGSAYGDTVLATILKAIQTTSMPNGLDVAAVDHLLGMTLGDAQTSLRQELETILLLANELLATGFISGDTQLATFILNSSSDQLMLAIAGGQALATPTIDVNLLLANMTPEIAQSIFSILSQSELITTLIPSAIETAASLDMVEAYVTPDIINSLMDTVDWSQELVTLGAVAAAAVDLDLHLMGSGGVAVDPLTFDSTKVETLALALADSQLISGALPIAMDTLASQYVPEPYYTDLAIADLDFTQYDWQAELTNIAGLVSETLHVYQTIDPENFSIFSVNPTDVDSLLNGIGSSTFIMDLFPTMVELGLEMALTQANITDMTIDLSTIVWADELAMISDVYTELYAVGGDPLTYNWSTAEEEKITAMNAGIAALFSSNLMPTILPAVLEYGVTMIPVEYEGWVDLSLIDLDGLTGTQWSEEFQSIFELYREIINPDGTFPTDPQALLNDSAKVDLIAGYLGNSAIITPLLSNALEQAVSSFDFATLLGFPFDATALNFDDVDWATEFVLIADIASHATTMDLANITSTDIDTLLNLILDSQVFYPALPEIISGLASSFDLATALPGVDLSLETLEAISTANGWLAEVDLLVHVFEIIEVNFGGINGIATFDFASYLSNASAPAVIQDMANTMLDSQLFYGAFTSLIIDALETASIPVSADTSTWTSVEWKAEVAVITDLLGVFSTYSLDIANLANIIDNPDIEGIIRDGLVPAFDSVILYDMLTDIMTSAVSGAGYALPGDIATWTSVEWKAEMSIVADVMEGLQDQGITLADLGAIVDNPNVGNVIRIVLVDALDSRLFGPIIKDTIESAIVSASLTVPADIDTWDNTVWATELGYIADVFDGINDYGLTLQTLSNLTTVTDAGGLIDNILVPAIDSQLIGDNIISTLKSSLTGSGLTVPLAMDSWTDAQWKVELSAIGAVLTAAQTNALDINSFTTIMDRTDIGTIMREVVVLMFDSEILGGNVKDTIQDSFAASPEVALPGDIDTWTTNEWKTEVLNLASVMDQLTAYDVNPADVGTIMDLPNAADAVEDILLAMMDSRMLKTSVQNVLTQTISSTGFATPDTSAWTDLQWETEIGEIADILATSDAEGLGLETLSSVTLSQATAASLGRLMNEVADSALLITGLNSTLNDLFNTPDIGQKLSSPISVDAALVNWEVELTHLAFITDNIANLANTASLTWADDTADTLIRLRRSQILGSHTETLLLDGFTSLGVNDYINASASDGIVYWIDVEIIREDAILPDPENPLLSLNNALGILDDTKDSISGAIPSGSGQAEALLSDINALHKDYGWIQDGKLTEIVDRGLDQAGIGTYLGVDADLLRPEVVETDPDELPLLGRLMDTIGSTDLNLLTFQASSTGLIDNILKNIELLEMFKAETPGDPAANVALITRMFSSSPDVQEIVREQGIIDLAHRENVATEGHPDETVLLSALNSMVGIKDILSNTTSLTNSQVLKDIRDLETVYEVIEGDDPLTLEPDGTLAEKTRDIIEGSAYFATYSPDMDYAQIYLDTEIDLLVNDILGVKDTLVIDDNTINSQKATLVSLFTDISSSMFLGNAREDILNDMIDDATARTGSDLLNAELPTFDWQGEMDAIDEGLDALPVGSLTTLDALTIDTLFNAANGTRIMSRIFVDELNGLSTELNTAPTPGFVWTTSKLTPIYSRTLAELIDVESLNPISEANYSSVGNKIAEFDRLIVLGDGLVNELVGDPFYDRALAANYLPAFITKVTTNAYSSVSKFDVNTDFSEVGAQFDEVTLAAKAVNSTYGNPINHAAAIVALESALDAAIAAGVEPEVAEMSLRIQGVVHVNTADYNSITGDYPAFAEMFILDITLD